MSITASIIGASGYSGAELLRLLTRHGMVKIEKLFANSSAGRRVDDVYPWFRGLIDAKYETYSVEEACTSDIVFVALPSGEAMSIVPGLIGRGKKVIDLGGDFRLKDPSLYERYYGHRHVASAFLDQAIYGLPELNRSYIARAQLIANPGCYPTSVLIPLVPLINEGIVAGTGIGISSMSGVSGAGRSASVDLSFVEVNESVKAYKVGNHQHIPEMKSVLESATGREISLLFVPYLVPITRGIYTTVHAPLSKVITADEILDVYERSYSSEPFVRYSATVIPEIRHVNHTNNIDIGFRVNPDTNQIVLLSAIDNLVKGAAGQAVQNMNLMFGFDETEGLI